MSIKFAPGPDLFNWCYEFDGEEYCYLNYYEFYGYFDPNETNNYSASLFYNYELFDSE